MSRDIHDRQTTGSKEGEKTEKREFGKRQPIIKQGVSASKCPCTKWRDKEGRDIWRHPLISTITRP